MENDLPTLQNNRTNSGDINNYLFSLPAIYNDIQNKIHLYK